MNEARFNFEKVGLGYRVWPTDDHIQTELRVSRIKRSSQELHGHLQVRCNFAGVKTVNGVLHSARFNLSSSTTRNALAKLLTTRTPGFENMDWFDALETLCQFVADAESRGEPVIDVTGPVVEREHGKWAIAPLVPAHVAALLYGPGGAGKSVLALAGALSVAVGREIVPGIAPSMKGPVLYLDWETDAYVVNERLWALCRGVGIEPTNVNYRRCNRPLADDAEELAMLVAEKGIVYLVIDSCGPAMGTSGEYGDANESTLRLFEAIRHIGISTQIVDHVSKQEMRNSKGKVTGLLPYGSIYKVNLARAAWELRNGTTDDDDDLKISLLNTKANDNRLHEPVNLLIEWEHGRIAFKPDTSEPEGDEEGQGPGSMYERARRMLASRGEMQNSELAAALGTTPGTLRTLCNRHPGTFERNPKTRAWKLVSPGGIGSPSNVVQFMSAKPSDT